MEGVHDGAQPMRVASRTFTATLERMPGNLNWVIIRVPLDVHKVWGVRGQLKVKGELRPAGSKAQGFAFRSALFPDGKGHHFMMVNKQMQAGAGVRAGVSAHFGLEPDTAPRPVPKAGDLERVL